MVQVTDTILEHRAQVAWEYRQRHKCVINEKARLHMQKHREELLNAPTTIQEEHSAKQQMYKANHSGKVQKKLATLKKKRKVKTSLMAASLAVHPKTSRRHPAGSCRYGYDGDEGNEEDLGPILNHTGYPDYVPEPGQQPYYLF
ncbi:hypothetical protein C8J57DRAFT_1235795 [Mycena rebaudengoi]|nr:hypothetical protein C8J57DRAFT_1235795 [Mycena rebaudengoi]